LPVSRNHRGHAFFGHCAREVTHLGKAAGLLYEPSSSNVPLKFMSMNRRGSDGAVMVSSDNECKRLSVDLYISLNTR
jgi:hypothetical protein